MVRSVEHTHTGLLEASWPGLTEDSHRPQGAGWIGAILMSKHMTEKWERKGRGLVHVLKEEGE